MKKVLLALFVCVLSVNVFACGGHDDGEENKKFEAVTTHQL